MGLGTCAEEGAGAKPDGRPLEPPKPEPGAEPSGRPVDLDEEWSGLKISIVLPRILIDLDPAEATAASKSRQQLEISLRKAIGEALGSAEVPPPELPPQLPPPSPPSSPLPTFAIRYSVRLVTWPVGPPCVLQRGSRDTMVSLVRDPAGPFAGLIEGWREVLRVAGFAP